MSAAQSLAESRYAWARLAAALALMTLGGSGVYAVTVVLPRVQAEFGVGRSEATLLGMALGGWMSGAIFDFTGSYRAAFINGIAWNLVNMAIVAALLYRARTRAAFAG